MVMVVALGFAINRPLYPTGIVPEGHTHAFDNFCSPLLEGETEPAKRCLFLVGTPPKAMKLFRLFCGACLSSVGWSLANLTHV